MSKTDSESSERRGHERKPINLRVSYKNAHALVAAYTTSVSKGGCLIQTRKPLPEGTLLSFEMFTFEDEGAVKIKGRVTRASAIDADGLSALAISFEPEGNDRPALERFLDKALAEHKWETARKSPRLPVNLVAEDKAQPAVHYLLRDLSVGGAGFQMPKSKKTPARLKPGATVTLEATVEPPLACALKAKVVWLIEGRKEFTHTRFGVQFASLSPDERTVVDLLMRLHRPQRLTLSL